MIAAQAACLRTRRRKNAQAFICRNAAGENAMNRTRSSTDDLSLAYALLRVAMGLNIFMHGISRFLGGVGNFVNSMIQMFQNTVLPRALVVPFGYALPWLEASVGLLLLIGFRTREALVAGSLVMLALTFGTIIRQDWNVAAIQLLYSTLYALLIAGLRYNSFCLDPKASAAASSSTL
jgi:thiosulfate dehydrogenase [quinone] large subunit